MGIGILCCEKPRDDSNSKNLQINSFSENVSVNQKLDKHGKHLSPKYKELNQFYQDQNKNETTNNADDINECSYFHIFLDKFELTYSKYDDFGMKFVPEFLMKFDEIKEIKIMQYNPNAFNENKNEELSNMNSSQLDNTNNNMMLEDNNNKSFFNKSTITTPDKNKSNLENSFSGSGKKTFSYNFMYTLNLRDLENWKNKNLKLKLYNKSKKSEIFSIQIGSFSVPLIDIHSKNSVEGKIPIKNILIKEIGLLYCRLLFSDSRNFENINFSLNNNLSKNFFNSNNNNVSFATLNESSIINLNNNKKSQFTSPIETEDIIFEHYSLGKFELLDKSLRSNFKIRLIDPISNTTNEEKYMENLNSKMVQINKVRNINEETTNEKYFEMLFESLIKGQQILIYGILNNMTKKIYDKDIEFINSLCDKIKKQEEENNILFFNLAQEAFEYGNYSLSKSFFYFLYNLIEFLRFLELQNKKFCTRVNFEEICSIIINNLGLLHESITLNKNISKNDSAIINRNTNIISNGKHNNFNTLKNFTYEQIEEIKETVYWMFNCINLLVTPNLSDDITDLSIINVIYTITFKNSVKIITMPKYLIDIFLIFNEDSDICGSTAKIIRKCLQLILDDSNNYIQVKDRPKIISNSIRELIIHDEKYQKFLVFIEFCFMRYIHFPEIYSNVLLILICLSHDYCRYPEIIRKILDYINMKSFCDQFIIYRGKINKFGKNINYFFYKFLLNLTTLNKSFEESETLVNLKKDELEIFCNEIAILYKMKEDSIKKANYTKSKILTFFLKNKNIELHEIICSICGNITKNTDACILICKENNYLLQDLIDYFFKMTKDYLLVFLNKYKNKKKEKIPLIISIIDNTLLTFDNLITRSKITKNYFLNILQLKSHSKNTVINHISELIDASTTLLNYNNHKMKKTAENFINNFE